jgi:hypothetical protein
MLTAYYKLLLLFHLHHWKAVSAHIHVSLPFPNNNKLPFPNVLPSFCRCLQRMVKQRNLPFSFQPEQGSRVGLLPRGADDDAGMIWFDLPAHMVFHVANAWEEEDGTVKVRGGGWNRGFGLGGVKLWAGHNWPELPAHMVFVLQRYIRQMHGRRRMGQ